MARSIPEPTDPDAAAGRAEPRRSRSPTLGLQASDRFAWAQVVPDVDADELARLLRDRKGEGSIEGPVVGRYAAVVSGGRLYRLNDSAANAPFGHVESFWAYLQRRLRAKGGIRRQRLGLYLAEYAWRYNNRRLTPSEQLRELMKAIRRRHSGAENKTYPEPNQRDSVTGFHRSSLR
jgi:hypothetical protein